MKKLMIAACAVALAGVAQAYSIDWGINAKAFEMADGSHPNGVKVYLVNTSAASWSDWDGLGKTALMALATGGITADNIASQSFFAGEGTTYYNADTSKTAFKNSYAKISNAVGTGAGVTLTADNYAAIIFDSTTKSPANYYIVSEAASAKGYESNPDFGVPINFIGDSFAAGASLSGGWQQVSAVPEPTSGLLLLLGVAGLALRRRRA